MNTYLLHPLPRSTSWILILWSKLEVCMIVRRGWFVYDTLPPKKKLTYSSTHRHPLEVWVGATKRNLQSTRASSLPPSTRKEMAIDSMDLGRSVAPCHFYFCCYFFFETGTLPNLHGHSYTQARSNLMITWKNM